MLLNYAETLERGVFLIFMIYIRVFFFQKIKLKRISRGCCTAVTSTFLGNYIVRTSV